MDSPNEFLVPSTPPEDTDDNGGYTSGNPSQYATYMQDDSSDPDDPEYQESSDNDPFVDEFPAKLTKALKPIALSQGLRGSSGEDEDESDDDGGKREYKLTEEQERWLDYNDDLIQLHDTMRSAEDQDLAHQLLNVHGLKTTRYDLEKLRRGEVKGYHNRKHWQRVVEGGSREELERKAFEEDETWTAWPLEPEVVPRMGEEQVLEDRRWTEKVRPHLRAGLRYKPSKELEEQLGGVVLKRVAEKWHKRKFARFDEGESDEEEDEEEVMRELGIERQEETEEMRRGYERQEMGDQFDPMDNVEEDVWRKTHRRYRDRGEPVLEVDDEINAARMKPAISHALSRLDDLLLALRRNKLAVETPEDSRPTSRDGQSQSQTGSAYDSSDDESEAKSQPGSRGRPRKKRRLHEIPEAPRSQHKKQRFANRGRPRKVHVPLGGESERDMLIRIAREQKRPIPIFSDDEGEEGEEVLIKDEYIDMDDMMEEEEVEGEPEENAEVEDSDEQQEEEREEDGDGEEDEGEDEEEGWKPIPNPNEPVPFVPITQADILKDSDGSSDDLTSEAVLAPYDNWPFPSETWPERKARIFAKRAKKAEEKKLLEARFGKRAWLDVVGVAASIGFPAKVIERTAARMTSMLGEDMDLRVFTRLPKGDAETLVTYKPDQIPSDDGLFESSSEEESDVEEDGEEDEDEVETDDSTSTSRKSFSTHSRTSSKDSKAEPQNKDSDNELSSGSDSSSDSEDEYVYECPIDTCERHIEGREMSSQKALRAHLRKRHSWTEEDIEDFYEVETDEEECLGGVHRDGFLMKLKSEDYYDRRRERNGESGSGSDSDSEVEEGKEEMKERGDREVSIEL